jgi:hypothetical protein
LPYVGDPDLTGGTTITIWDTWLDNAHLGSGDLLLVDAGTLGAFERIHLQMDFLGIGQDASIADFHGAKTKSLENRAVHRDGNGRDKAPRRQADYPSGLGRSRKFKHLTQTVFHRREFLLREHAQ